MQINNYRKQSELRGALRLHGLWSVMALLLLSSLLTGARAGEKTPPNPPKASPAKPQAAKKPQAAPVKLDPAQARKDVQAVYDQQAAALTGKNVNGFLALCTPDYRDIALSHQVYTAERLRQGLGHQLAKFPADYKMTMTVQTFQLKGAQANVTARRHVQLTRKNTLTHRSEPWSSDTTTQDVWVKTAQGWRTKSSKETAFKKLPTPKTPLRKPVKGKTSARPAQ